MVKSNKKYLKTYDREKNKGLNEISAKVLKIMEDRGITNYQIEKDTGIYASTLDNSLKLKGSWKTALVLMKLADYFKVDINELLPGKRVHHPPSLEARIKDLEERNAELKRELDLKAEAIRAIRKAAK